MKGWDLLDLLDQDEVWQTRNGDTLRVEDMAASHRANVLRWLDRRARNLQLSEHFRFVDAGLPDPETVAFDMVTSGITDYFTQPPAEWLAEQPLVIRLRELDAAEVRS